MKISNKLRAFLQTIQFAIGTSHDPYKYNRISGLLRYGIESLPELDAGATIGAYELDSNDWVKVAAKLKIKDFTPASQDKAAIELITQKKALKDVEDDNIADALYKVRAVWNLPKTKSNPLDLIIINRLVEYYEKQLKIIS